VDQEGQVTLEEDRQSMGSSRLVRTLFLFKDEALILSIGFVIVFIQVAMSTFIPQLSQAYQEAMFDPLVSFHLVFLCSIHVLAVFAPTDTAMFSMGNLRDNFQ
jgi:hypothetical protein